MDDPLDQRCARHSLRSRRIGNIGRDLEVKTFDNGTTYRYAMQESA